MSAVSQLCLGFHSELNFLGEFLFVLIFNQINIFPSFFFNLLALTLVFTNHAVDLLLLGGELTIFLLLLKFVLLLHLFELLVLLQTQLGYALLKLFALLVLQVIELNITIIV